MFSSLPSFYEFQSPVTPLYFLGYNVYISVFCFQACLSDALGPWGLRGSQPIPGSHGTPCEPACAAAAAVCAGAAAQQRCQQERPSFASRVALSQDGAPSRPTLRSVFAETQSTEWAFWSNSLSFLFPSIIVRLCVIIYVLSHVHFPFRVSVPLSHFNHLISTINIIYFPHDCCAVRTASLLFPRGVFLLKWDVAMNLIIAFADEYVDICWESQLETLTNLMFWGIYLENMELKQSACLMDPMLCFVF